MKRLSLILVVLFAVGIARSTTYELPVLFPESCGGVQKAFDPVSGRVWERTQCPTGGRGTRPRHITACADVTWNADGTIASSVTLWLTREVGTQYPHAEACL